MKYIPVQQKLYLNTSKPCKAKGCTKARIGFSGYCSSHNKRRLWYGDAEGGRRFYPKDFELEAQEVRQLIKHNSEHPGIKAGLDYFDGWLKSATSGIPGFAHRQIAQVADRGVTGEDLLVDCAALYVFASRYPWILQIGEPLRYALSIAVLTKARNKRGCVSAKPLKADLRRMTGRHIESAIGTLLVNFVSSSRKKEQEKESRREALGLPLRIDN